MSLVNDIIKNRYNTFVICRTRARTPVVIGIFAIYKQNNLLFIDVWSTEKGTYSKYDYHDYIFEYDPDIKRIYHMNDPKLPRCDIICNQLMDRTIKWKKPKWDFDLDIVCKTLLEYDHLMRDVKTKVCTVHTEIDLIMNIEYIMNVNRHAYNDITIVCI